MSNAGFGDLLDLNPEDQGVEETYLEVEHYGEAKRIPIRDSVTKVRRSCRVC